MTKIQSIDDLLRLDEGDRGLPYKDSDGIWTVARGHNLEANGLPPGVFADAPGGAAYPACLDFLLARGGVTPAEDEALFKVDLEANRAWLEAKPWWGALDEVRRAALSDAAFNLGPARFQKFEAFLGLIAAGVWAAAAADLRGTAVYRQLPVRYARLAAMVETGAWPA